MNRQLLHYHLGETKEWNRGHEELDHFPIDSSSFVLSSFLTHKTSVIHGGDRNHNSPLLGCRFFVSGFDTALPKNSIVLLSATYTRFPDIFAPVPGLPGISHLLSNFSLPTRFLMGNFTHQDSFCQFQFWVWQVQFLLATLLCSHATGRDSTEEANVLTLVLEGLEVARVRLLIS